MQKPFPPISYKDYLKTEELLCLQQKRSDEFGHPAHDEMLFIIVHQTYELWFKQVLTEIESVRQIFSNTHVAETQLGTAVSRLERIIEIQRLLVDQVTVLETMTALDFLEFRDFLYPASGFQSTQFRLIENKLGLKRENRLPFNALPYSSFVSEGEQKALQASEQEDSIFTLVEKWLERTPFLEKGSFKFWDLYRRAVENMLGDDKQVIQNNSRLSAEEKEKNLQVLTGAQETFSAFFDAEKFAKLRAEGAWRMSHRALQAALLIQIYRDQPILHLPYRLIGALQDIDELMTTWRYRHALMAQRMLGSKIGTGGSSGARYLKAATDQHKVYADFSNLATFLIPRSQIPPLPKEVSESLGFYYS